MAKKKEKVNPRRIPVTKEQKEREVRDHAITLCWAIFFTVLHDKEGYGMQRCQRVWKHITELSDGIKMGYVKPKDLLDVLEEEVGIVLK